MREGAGDLGLTVEARIREERHHDNRHVLPEIRLHFRQPAGYWVLGFRCMDLIAARIYDKFSVDPSIRPMCTRDCFTMTNMIQVCNNFSLNPSIYHKYSLG